MSAGPGDSQGRHTRSSEGLASLRASTGAYSMDGELDRELGVDETVLVGRFDVAGKPRITIYAENTGIQAGSIILSWHINDVVYAEAAIALAVAAGPVITDRQRAATHLQIQLSTTIAGGTSFRWHAMATH